MFNHHSLLKAYLRLAFDNVTEPLFIKHQAHIGMNIAVTHISLASLLWDIGKQYTHRPDAAERETLFDYRIFYKNLQIL